MRHETGIVLGRRGQGRFGNVGSRGFGRGGQVVVAPIARAIGFGQSGYIGDGDCFAIGRVFVVKSALPADEQSLAIEQVIEGATCDGGRCRPVIDFVGCSQRVKRDIATTNHQVGLRCQCRVEAVGTQAVGIAAHVFTGCTSTGQACQHIRRGHCKSIVTPHTGNRIGQGRTTGACKGHWISGTVRLVVVRQRHAEAWLGCRAEKHLRPAGTTTAGHRHVVGMVGVKALIKAGIQGRAGALVIQIFKA